MIYCRCFTPRANYDAVDALRHVDSTRICNKPAPTAALYAAFPTYCRTDGVVCLRCLFLDCFRTCFRQGRGQERGSLVAPADCARRSSARSHVVAESNRCFHRGGVPREKALASRTGGQADVVETCVARFDWAAADH